jgi:hypothetical protein
VTVEARVGVTSDVDTLNLAQTDTVGPLDASVLFQSHSASSWASIEDGVLHGFATASDPAISDGLTALGQASIAFTDTLLITSSSLALGTPVQLQVDLLFSRSVSGAGNCAVSPTAVGLARTSFQASFTGVIAEVQDSYCDSQDINSPTAVLSTFIGAEFQVFSSLFVTGFSFLGTATADAGSTARFFLTPLQDFSYVTASGNDYSQQTAVPEPASALLLLAGLGAVARRTRRARRRSGPTRCEEAQRR